MRACCNRLMYRKTVQEFKMTNNGKPPKEFIVPESQNMQWICKTCHGALKRGVLPAPAKANNLELDDVPVELSDTGSASYFTADPLHEDGGTSTWQAMCHSWTSCHCPH